jgi:nickel transport protein
MRKLLPISLVSTLVGGSLAGSSLLSSEAAWALSDDAIVAKLQQVPVFIILNSEGQTLTASVESEDAEEIKFPVVYFDGETAESTLAEMLSEAQAEGDNALLDSVNDAQVEIRSLGWLYEEYYLNNDNETIPPIYVPIGEAVEAATSIDPNFTPSIDPNLSGVPLFYLTIPNGDATEEFYVEGTYNGEDVIPFFLSRDDLQSELDEFADSSDNPAEDFSVRVTSLGRLLNDMSSDDPNASGAHELFRLIPSTDVLEYIQDQQGSAPAAE